MRKLTAGEAAQQLDAVALSIKTIRSNMRLVHSRLHSQDFRDAIESIDQIIDHLQGEETE